MLVLEANERVLVVVVQPGRNEIRYVNYPRLDLITRAALRPQSIRFIGRRVSERKIGAAGKEPQWLDD